MFETKCPGDMVDRYLVTKNKIWMDGQLMAGMTTLVLLTAKDINTIVYPPIF